MSKVMVNKVRANIDQAVCGCGVLYVIGWGFIEEGRDRDTKVILKGGPNNQTVEIPVRHVHRSDVNEHFGLDATRDVGFTIQHPLSSLSMDELPAGQYDIIVQCVDIEGRLFDVCTQKVSIQWPEDIHAIQPGQPVDDSSKSTLRNPLRVLYRSLKKVWLGRCGVMDEDLQSNLFARDVTAQGILKLNVLSEDIWPAVIYTNSVVVKVAALFRQASRNSGLVVIFDHNFGGGANLFSGQLVSDYRKTGNVVLRVWYDPTCAQVVGNASYLESDYPIEIGGLNELFSLLSAFHFAVIHVNNLYGWPYLERVLDNILRLRIYGRTERVEFYAHDHLPICPSLFLLNSEEEYCGVPSDPKVCNVCLQNNGGTFKVFYQQREILPWRAPWRSLLLNADYVRFFSGATRREYLKAFPELEQGQNSVVDPHDVNLSYREAYSVEASVDPIRVGVFGFIDRHKGSEVILDLVDAIKSGNVEMEVHIFGALNGIVSGEDKVLKIHGPYDRNELVNLLNKYKINVAVVPSVCPETFSFVTAELLETGINVVTFDLGAQAELAKAKSNGHVVSDVSPGHLLNIVRELNGGAVQC